MGGTRKIDFQIFKAKFLIVSYARKLLKYPNSARDAVIYFALTASINTLKKTIPVPIDAALTSIT